MTFIYLDESGELGFAKSSSRFFVIATLATDNPKRLKNRVRKVKKKIFDAGWPSEREIKGTSLFGCHRDRYIPQKIRDDKDKHIEQFLRAALFDESKVHYSIVRKSRIAQHIRDAEYGIAYNFYTGKLLTRAYEYFQGDIDLTVDQRNKETHHKLPFDGYVKTQIITECNHSSKLTISHRESHDVIGLQAVDFVSWAIFRKFEHDDARFFNLLKPYIGYCDNWYA
ncbi:DUF3800 domain-containing protein [Thalassospira povalilytica]|uniref:DUF3800 domain-containing protein n=1 Tax=Thalassospira povalilytica TaxID=732237 RepID=UPI001D17F6CF|nr:DUF3800 domain-containing protein [Thalassospira povalilytica]MCC4238748.1 DUF3800 domain-containing protein [Thalassospira povalilytica]